MKRIFRSHLMLLLIQVIVAIACFAIDGKFVSDKVFGFEIVATVLFTAVAFVITWFTEHESFDLEDVFVGAISALCISIIYFGNILTTSLFWPAIALVVVCLCAALSWLLVFAARVFSIDTNESQALCAMSKIPVLGLFVSAYIAYTK